MYVVSNCIVYLAQSLNRLPNFTQKLGLFVKKEKKCFQHYILTKFSCCSCKFLVPRLFFIVLYSSTSTMQCLEISRMQNLEISRICILEKQMKQAIVLVKSLLIEKKMSIDNKTARALVNYASALYSTGYYSILPT